MTGSTGREGRDERKSLHLKTTHEAGINHQKFQKICSGPVKTAVHHPKQGQQESTYTLIGLKDYSSPPPGTKTSLKALPPFAQNNLCSREQKKLVFNGKLRNQFVVTQQQDLLVVTSNV